MTEKARAASEARVRAFLESCGQTPLQAPPAETHERQVRRFLAGVNRQMETRKRRRPWRLTEKDRALLRTLKIAAD